MRWGGVPAIVQLLAVPVLFFLGAKLSLAFAIHPGPLVTLWLPNGVLLVSLLHFGLRRFLPFAAAVLVAEIAADYPAFPLSESLLYGLINVGEATVAWLLLRRWRFDPAFATPADLVRFLVAGPVVAALLAACAAAGVHLRFEGAPGFLQFLRLWWFSDGLGVLLVTPLALSLWPVRSRPRVEALPLRWYDLLVVLGAIVVLVMFLQSRNAMFAGWPLRPVLLLPFVLYASMRLTPRWTILVITLFAIAVLNVTANGQQPYGDIPLQQTLLQVQQFIAIMAVGGLGISSLLAQLRANVAQLEARVAERTIELREANEQLRQMAVTDPLTGLANRRALLATMQREIERARRHGHPLAVVIFDIDRFKAVNDTYGHAVGDRAIRRVAEVAQAQVRGTDLLSRYGGEEFILLAPETDAPRALGLAERIRTALHEARVPVDHTTIQVTASFGIAMLRDGDRDAEMLISRADGALYAAKVGGRDRVMGDGPPTWG